ncbi:Subtilisin-like serine protease [Collimonas arenae]|uniref:Subtilisin-like serine protease n=1 Tax=Collimonas arenae TaxID=279058 RepID=A0A0A1FMF5_9BURK|nr:Subtilisin-like serine protease [Collimonas arenae]
MVPAVLVTVLMTACTSPPPAAMPGSDRDAHGCIPSAGYQWDEAQQQCVRPWEKK